MNPFPSPEPFEVSTTTIGGIPIVFSSTDSYGTILCIPHERPLSPEDNAMLQALYSRSNEGMLHHLKEMHQSKIRRLMEKFYVGYGHKSIGDCGSTTVFIENVSMLAAKALQHCQLYNGQERSTRYVDFGTARFFDPFPAEYDGREVLKGNAILEGWRQLYQEAYPKVLAHLSEQYPPEDEDHAVHNRAVKARAFDICRGLLPAGTLTCLSWHGELSTFGDQLPKLKSHPLTEIRGIAKSLEAVLSQVFRYSFPIKNQGRLEEYYMRQPVEETYFHDPGCPAYTAINRVDPSVFPEPIETTAKPSAGDPLLPERYKEGGTVEMQFLLDYGSYRDIARHRAVFQRLPLLTMDHGMHPWYLDAFSEIDGVTEKVGALTDRTLRFMGAEETSMMLRKQYYIPMGFRVSCRLTGNLWALAYLVRLRCSSKVHPTLVNTVLQMRDTIAPFVSVRLNEDPLRFNPRRGKDTITRK